MRTVKAFLSTSCVATVVDSGSAQRGVRDTAAVQPPSEEGKRWLDEGQLQSAGPKLEESPHLGKATRRTLLLMPPERGPVTSAGLQWESQVGLGPAGLHLQEKSA